MYHVMRFLHTHGTADIDKTPLVCITLLSRVGGSQKQQVFLLSPLVHIRHLEPLLKNSHINISKSFHNVSYILDGLGIPVVPVPVYKRKTPHLMKVVLNLNIEITFWLDLLPFEEIASELPFPFRQSSLAKRCQRFVVRDNLNVVSEKLHQPHVVFLLILIRHYPALKNRRKTAVAPLDLNLGSGYVHHPIRFILPRQLGL